MLSLLLLYIGSGMVIIWGIAHIVPTRSVVNGFGQITADNKKIITMEWIAEGLAMCFIGVLTLLVTLTGSQNPVTSTVYLASAAMLIIMAGLTASTGARTSIVPIKICPVVKTVVAVLFILGAVL